jgi:surface protein
VLKLDTNIKDCSFMLYNCHKIIELDLSFLLGSKIMNMGSMFGKCNIKYNDFYSFKTNNVTCMKDLFSECWNLKMIDLLDFNIGKAKDMSNMFSDCKSLINLNLNSFYTKKVINMSNIS